MVTHSHTVTVSQKPLPQTQLIPNGTLLRNSKCGHSAAKTLTHERNTKKKGAPNCVLFLFWSVILLLTWTEFVFSSLFVFVPVMWCDVMCCTLHIIFMYIMVTKMNFFFFFMRVCVLCISSASLSGDILGFFVGPHESRMKMVRKKARTETVMEVNVYSSIVISAAEKRDCWVPFAFCHRINCSHNAVVNMCASLVFSFDLFQRNHLMMNHHWNWIQHRIMWLLGWAFWVEKKREINKNITWYLSSFSFSFFRSLRSLTLCFLFILFERIAGAPCRLYAFTMFVFTASAWSFILALLFVLISATILLLFFVCKRARVSFFFLHFEWIGAGWVGPVFHHHVQVTLRCDLVWLREMYV